MRNPFSAVNRSFNQTLVVEVDENKRVKRTYLVNDESINDLSPRNIELVSGLEIKDICNQPSNSIHGSDESKNVITYRIKARGKFEKITDIVNPTKKVEAEIEANAGECCVLENNVSSRESSPADVCNTSVVLGKKNGKRFVDGQGYSYYQHYVTSSRRNLRCTFANYSKYKCMAKASVSLDRADAPIELLPENPGHNHPAETKQTLGSKFIIALRDRVHNEADKSVRDIYEDECKKFPGLGRVLPPDIALSRMRRFRRIQKKSIKPETVPHNDKTTEPAPKASTELAMSYRGRVVFVDQDGYRYHQQFSTANMRQLRCIIARKTGVEKCCARASMALRPRYAPIRVTRAHNHPPGNASSSTFLNNIKRRARFDQLSIREIYDEEGLRFPRCTTEYPFNRVKRAMQRLRKLRDDSGSAKSGCDAVGPDVDFDETPNSSQIARTTFVESPNSEIPNNNSSLQNLNLSGLSQVSDASNLLQIPTSVYECPYCSIFCDSGDSLALHILTH